MKVPTRALGLAATVLALVAVTASCGSPSGPGTPETSSVPTPEVQTSTTSPPSASSASPSGPGSAASSAGTGTGTGSPSSSGTASGTAATTPRDTDLRDHRFAVTVERALQISDRATGAGTVHSIELDWSARASAWVWSIDTLVGAIDHDVEIHADTGTVLAHDQDANDDPERAVDPTSPLSLQAAQAKALALRDGPIRSWTLESDDGRAEYQFDIEVDGRTEEVVVDVASGQARLD